jgi:hypothetical protein
VRPGPAPSGARVRRRGELHPIGLKALSAQQRVRIAAGDHHMPGPGAWSQEGNQVIQEPAVRLHQVQLDDFGGSRAVPGLYHRRPSEQLPGQPAPPVVATCNELATRGDHVDLHDVGSVVQRRGQRSEVVARVVRDPENTRVVVGKCRLQLDLFIELGWGRRTGVALHVGPGHDRRDHQRNHQPPGDCPSETTLRNRAMPTPSLTCSGSAGHIPDPKPER